LNIDSTAGNDTPPARFNEENRRRQLIEVTIDSLAELGYLGTTLAQIAGRAGVTPGLVAHYFGDKDSLLADAFRTLVRRVSKQVRVRLASAGTPRDRIHALIDGHLAPEEFDQRSGRAWLAFWSQVPQVESLNASRWCTSAACCPTFAARSISSCPRRTCMVSPRSLPQ
jgi:AcrR family transcriptional regulator